MRAHPSRKALHEISCALRDWLTLEAGFGTETVPASSGSRQKESPLRGGSGDNLGLKQIEREVASCVKCSLHRGRSQTVFGEGSPRAELMFVGEAPGAEEDRQGRPFVGQAGQLLTKIIESIGLRREEVYIANVIKCRPPGNRGPLPEEVHTCSPYLVRQITLIRPRIICALGRYATLVLVRKEESLSLLRGRFYDYQGIPVMPTFHPAYLLRNPSAKRLVWEDMKKIRNALKESKA